jgi:hypothetical protein
MKELEHIHEVDDYGDPRIASGHGKIPWWLWVTYAVLPIWGFIALAMYWNGSWGWLDRGYWQQLQRAANTTYPHINYDSMPENQQQMKP